MNSVKHFNRMKRQTVIVIITPVKTECWGNLKKACEAKGSKYNTLSRLRPPFEYRGHRIYRVPFM